MSKSIRNILIVVSATGLPILGACTGDVPFQGGDLGSDITGDDSATTAKCMTPDDADVLAGQLLQLINLERSEKGLDPVVQDTDGVLDTVAADYACQMITGGFFAHEHPATKSTPARRISSTSYRAYAVGENLAAGQRSPIEVVDQWMQSDSHRDNLLSPEWREAGVAVRVGGIHETYWVLELADPHPSPNPSRK